MSPSRNQQQIENEKSSAADFHHWHNLIHSVNRVDYFSNWLALLGDSVKGVVKSYVLVHEENNLIPSGYWPSNESVLDNESYLLAKDAVEENKALIEKIESSTDHLLSFPLKINQDLSVVVILQVSNRSHNELSEILQKLQLSSAWLELIFRREESDQDQHLVEQAVTTLNILSSISKKPDSHSAAIELVTILASDLACEKVVYGNYVKHDVEIIALSNNGQFGRKMDVMRSITDLMLEAIDQGRSIVSNEKKIPSSLEETQSNNHVSFKHQQYINQNSANAVMSIPCLADNGRCIGAITLERTNGEPFSDEALEFAATISQIVANMIYDKAKNEQSIFKVIGNRFSGIWQSTISNRYPLRNAIIALLSLGLFSSVFIKGEFEVRANSVLEGFIERSVVAPFDGYIQLSSKRVGDAVFEGELLGNMDASDLQLELTELVGQQSQILSQVRESQAIGDRARAKIFQSQLDQIQSQINLINLRIERTNIVAPYDGYIVRGDLSRQLGAAISRGDVMFVVAPLDKYRVVMQVDEKDIAHVKKGSPVRLILTALPNERLMMEVSEITPIATAAGGQNYFRVEAQLIDDSKRLRPGMEGVVRIEAGQKSWLWIWIRDFVDWLRLFAWKWMP